MDISLLTIFSGAIGGSIITLIGTNIVSFVKDKKAAKNVKKSFVEILDKTYNLSIDKLIEDCDYLKGHLKTQGVAIYRTNDSSFLKANIFDIVDKNILIKLFISKKISIDELFFFTTMLKTCADNTPKSIIDSFYNERTSYIEQTKKDLSFLFLHKENITDDYKSSKQDIENIQADNLQYLCKNSITQLDICKKNLTLLKKISTKIISNLK